MIFAQSSGRDTVLIVLTVTLALLLSIIPMGTLSVMRPLWLTLVLSSWAILKPTRMSLVSVWILGLVEDVLYGTLLGQHALVLVLSIFLVRSLYRQAHMFPLWQQALLLFGVFGLGQLLQLWLYNLSGHRASLVSFLLPALTSAILWPFLHRLLSMKLRSVHIR